MVYVQSVKKRKKNNIIEDREVINLTFRKLKENVYSVGAIDWDRTIFDELIPLPDGTSYNSYLVKGSQKIALIDTVDPKKSDELFENLEDLGINRIDYVISNHAEQDHSGTIPMVLNKFPEAKVITNKKCKNLEKDLLAISDEKFITVEDGETLSLGDKTLKFIFTPWVHWPETMSTYLMEDKIMFTCDFFGSHIASSDLFVDNESKAIEDAKRYYAEIMMPFRAVIRSDLKKVKGFDVDFIAPSHGQVYNHPKLILDAYEDWISDKVRDKVVIIYASMHGSTKKIVEHLTGSLMKKGVKVKPFNVITADVGEIAMALVDAATVVVASPTVLIGLHPKVAYVVSFANAIKPKVKFMSFVGSYGWGGKAIEQLKGLTPHLSAEIIEPVLIKGFPRTEDFNSLDELAQKISIKHKECEFVKK